MKLERWGWGSIAVNVVLVALHGAVALRSGSLAVAAELVHNVVDLLSAVAVLVGLKLRCGSPVPSPTACTRSRTWSRRGSL
jgi:divalent metal cation (Fe/Co/Zn/Cd) transporter